MYGVETSQDSVSSQAPLTKGKQGHHLGVLKLSDEGEHEAPHTLAKVRASLPQSSLFMLYYVRWEAFW
jgi:hypothetical protein